MNNIERSNTAPVGYGLVPRLSWPVRASRPAEQFQKLQEEFKDSLSDSPPENKLTLGQEPIPARAREELLVKLGGLWQERGGAPPPSSASAVPRPALQHSQSITVPMISKTDTFATMTSAIDPIGDNGVRDSGEHVQFEDQKMGGPDLALDLGMDDAQKQQGAALADEMDFEFLAKYDGTNVVAGLENGAEKDISELGGLVSFETAPSFSDPVDQLLGTWTNLASAEIHSAW
jgi:hypothetical protein